MKAFFEYIVFVMRSKGITKVIPRLRMLIERFDVRGRKMDYVVHATNALGAKYHFKPAMIVPAVVLNRHRQLLQYANNSHLEFGIHGYVHKSHRQWDLIRQTAETEKGKAIFEALGMPYSGFRAPYLSCNKETDDALEKTGFLWNSDQSIMWPCDAGLDKQHGYHLKEAIDFLYAPDRAEFTLSLPRMHGSLVNIPITFPDDEILVDRLGITDPEKIAEIWVDVFTRSHARGDLFVLQLHPERFPFCERGMVALLDAAEATHGQVWTTSMHDIAVWWRERNTFSFEIASASDNKFDIACNCSDRAVVLMTSAGEQVTSPFRDGYGHCPKRKFQMVTDGRRPCIGIHPACEDAFAAFVRALGFGFELSEDEAAYSVYFGKETSYSIKDEVAVLKRIEQANGPLLRYWLWPDGFQSALATTHDLDCVTLIDFVYRALGR